MLIRVYAVSNQGLDVLRAGAPNSLEHGDGKDKLGTAPNQKDTAISEDQLSRAAIAMAAPTGTKNDLKDSVRCELQVGTFRPRHPHSKHGFTAGCNPGCKLLQLPTQHRP